MTTPSRDPARRSRPARPHGADERSRTELASDALLDGRQGEIQRRHGSDRAADPSTRRRAGTTALRRGVIGAAIGAAAGLAAGIAVVLVTSVDDGFRIVLPLSVAGAGAVIGAVLAALVALAREDGRVQREVQSDVDDGAVPPGQG